MKSKILETAISAAIASGKIQLKKVGLKNKIEKKFNQDTNLVTEVDKLCEEKIISIIHKKYPTHNILTEETGEYKRDSNYKWIVDPIDGTTNFAHALPIFCTSIGVEYENEIICGVIYNPLTDELFYSTKNNGAFLNKKRIYVSESNKIIDSLLVTGFPYNVKENPDNVIGIFNKMLAKARGVRRLGSAAIDFAYVACGRFDGYWELFLNPWDKAAGILLVTEAGGVVTNFKNEKANPFQKDSVATNGKIHKELIKILRS